MVALGKDVDVLNVELPKVAWVAGALAAVVAVLLVRPNPPNVAVVEFGAAGV